MARNLRFLMDAHAWTQADVAKAAGVSQKTISNLLAPDRYQDAKLETVEQVAQAFGLDGWHLILPNLPDDLINKPTMRALYDAFRNASPDGRAMIMSVAEREALYTASNDK